jgi:hypothetical protein
MIHVKCLVQGLPCHQNPVSVHFATDIIVCLYARKIKISCEPIFLALISLSYCSLKIAETVPYNFSFSSTSQPSTS